MLFDILWIIGSFGILFIASHFLIKSAVDIANFLGVSRLLISITIIGFGTALPEVFVSFSAAAKNTAAGDAIAMGNIIGSNILNILMIIGIAATISPMSLVGFKDDVSSEKYALGLMALMSVFCITGGKLDIWEGAALLSIFAYFTFSSIRVARKEMAQDAGSETTAKDKKRFITAIFYSIGTIVLLKYGAHFLVDHSVNVARHLGVGEAIISTTIVAFGTAFPEHITAILAAIEKKSDVAIGNVLGSNIFNIGVVIAGCAFMNTEVDTKFMQIDIPIMLVSMVIFFIILKKSSKISRWMGIGFILFYAIYSYMSVSYQNKHMPESSPHVTEPTSIELATEQNVSGSI